jgi:hypothetical protein
MEHFIYYTEAGADISFALEIKKRILCDTPTKKSEKTLVGACSCTYAFWIFLGGVWVLSREQ